MSFLENKTPVLANYLRNQSKDLSIDELDKLRELHKLYASYLDIDAAEDTVSTIETLHRHTMAALNSLNNKSPVYKFVDGELFSPLNELFNQNLESHKNKNEKNKSPK